MAVGDIVSAVSGAGLTLVFTPAVGVSCMLTGFTLYTHTSSNVIGIGNSYGTEAANMPSSPQNCKFFMNNGLGLTISAIGGARTGFSGIQIQ